MNPKVSSWKFTQNWTTCMILDQKWVSQSKSQFTNAISNVSNINPKLKMIIWPDFELVLRAERFRRRLELTEGWHPVQQCIADYTIQFNNTLQTIVSTLQTIASTTLTIASQSQLTNSLLVNIQLVSKSKFLEKQKKVQFDFHSTARTTCSIDRKSVLSICSIDRKSLLVRLLPILSPERILCRYQICSVGSSKCSFVLGEGQLVILSSIFHSLDWRGIGLCCRLDHL